MPRPLSKWDSNSDAPKQWRSITITGRWRKAVLFLDNHIFRAPIRMVPLPHTTSSRFLLYCMDPIRIAGVQSIESCLQGRLGQHIDHMVPVRAAAPTHRANTMAVDGRDRCEGSHRVPRFLGGARTIPALPQRRKSHEASDAVNPHRSKASGFPRWRRG